MGFAGDAELFAEKFDAAIKGIQLIKQVLKQEVCLVQKSTAAEEHFYEESVREMDASTQIPKDADFFADQVEWIRSTVRPRKFGIESRLSWEDSIINNIDIRKRTTIRMGNRVARDVEARIWDVLSQSQSATTIRSLATAAAWNNATRANRIPHEDVAEAKSLVADSEVQSYQADHILASPTDVIFLLTNDYVMGSFDASTPALMKTGRLGVLLGLNLIEHPVITDDYSMVMEAKKAITWKEVSPLQTQVVPDPGKAFYLRAWEYGNAALTDPKAVCLITNTQA